MKQIDSFVNEIYQYTKGSKKEIQELKMEMKHHLVEAVEELKAEGMTERDAVETALSRFGGEHEMKKVVNQLVVSRKTTTEWLFGIVVATLIVTVVAFIMMMAVGEKNRSAGAFAAMHLSEELGMNEVVTDVVKDKITRIVDESDAVTKIEVMNTETGANFMKENPKSGAEREVRYSKTYTESSEDGSTSKKHTWVVSVGVGAYTELAFALLVVSGSLYWVLFALWASTVARQRNQLSVGWLVVFVLFNVLGYLLYSVAREKSSRDSGLSL